MTLAPTKQTYRIMIPIITKKKESPGLYVHKKHTKSKIYIYNISVYEFLYIISQNEHLKYEKYFFYINKSSHLHSRNHS